MHGFVLIAYICEIINRLRDWNSYVLICYICPIKQIELLKPCPFYTIKVYDNYVKLDLT